MFDYDFEPMCLDLFEGEATAAATQGDATGAGRPNTQGGKGEYAKVLFGKQPDAAAGEERESGKTNTVETTSDALADKAAAWNQLINGEYKDMYTQATQRMIDRRFRQTKELEAKVSAYQPVMDLLAARYGETDAQKIIEKIESDTAYWAEAADEAGMSVEQYKEMQRLQRENRALREAQERASSEEAANRQLQQWYSEAEQMAQTYKGFSLEAETQNPEFVKLLRSGLPMETAYRVVHMDAMMSDAMGTAIRRTEEKVASNVRARGARPAEAGASGSSGYTVKSDVTKLTPKDRAEIARRAAMGEKITF
jgi:hypothetical protein